MNMHTAPKEISEVQYMHRVIESELRIIACDLRHESGVEKNPLFG